jgi:ParB-like nuclease domain
LEGEREIARSAARDAATVIPPKASNPALIAPPRPRVWTPARADFPAYQESSWPTDADGRPMQMADKIIMRPVEALIPYARNARTHFEDQVAQIAGSIREFGFTHPILLDGENGIIAGHGRVLAARKLEESSWPTDADGRPMQMADKIIMRPVVALNAGWDDELLKID